MIQNLLYFLPRLSFNLLAGRKNYNDWKKQNYSLRKVTLNNKKLALELEEACRKDGFLTFAEFAQIEQFGENGYHNHHFFHGMTTTYAEWGKTLTLVCNEQDISNVVEFGCGDAKLALSLLKTARKQDVNLSWNGIEINPKLQEKVLKKFEKEGFSKNNISIRSNVTNMKIQRKSLAPFSYSLDSVPPQILLNTTQPGNFPNSLIGIQVKNCILTEIILDNTLLAKKHLSLKNGIYRNEKGQEFNLRSWKLHPYQRAFIPLNAFSVLKTISDKLPSQSVIAIIDEVQPPPPIWETNHLAVPKNLNISKDCKNLETFYKQAGERLLYYTTYLETITSMLSQLGFSQVEYDIEARLAKKLRKEKWEEKPGLYFIYGIVTGPKTSAISRKRISLSFPQVNQ